jgi:hypothetical protein
MGNTSVADLLGDANHITDLVRQLDVAVAQYERDHPGVRVTLDRRKFPLRMTVWQADFAIRPTPEMP